MPKPVTAAAQASVRKAGGVRTAGAAGRQRARPDGGGRGAPVGADAIITRGRPRLPLAQGRSTSVSRVASGGHAKRTGV